MHMQRRCCWTIYVRRLGGASLGTLGESGDCKTKEEVATREREKRLGEWGRGGGHHGGFIPSALRALLQRLDPTEKIEGAYTSGLIYGLYL
jgi:hypothetical protein